MKKEQNNRLYLIVCINILFIFASGCSEKGGVPQPPVNVPVVITNSKVSSLTYYSAKISGSCSGKGINSRGICWNTGHNPTIESPKVDSCCGEGPILGNLFGLKPNTTYYARAFAVNSFGNGYGNEITFNTPIHPEFIITSKPVLLLSGMDGFQFFAKCINYNVQLTKVSIINPNQDSIITHLNGNYFIMNEQFDLQSVGTAYIKEIGLWTFNFNGTTVENGLLFNADVFVQISK